MELRTGLSEWVDKIFGPIHAGDFFTMNEEVGATKKEGVYHRNIVISLRKAEGFKKDWTGEETFSRWRKELREIIGNKGVIKLEIKSAEDNALNYIGGIREGKKGEEEFSDAKARIFLYRFNISLIKQVRRCGEENER